MTDSSPEIPVIGSGFVRLVDSMGDDGRIVYAARRSYQKGTKHVSFNRALLRRLMRLGHCYHPNMQVLTVEGWKRWADCAAEETFLVPDPATRRLAMERLPVSRFDADEDLETFDNERMGYAVTGEHRMHFRGLRANSFRIYPASEMPHWGHFDPLSGYELHPEDGPLCPRLRLVGFYLGDGSLSGRKLVFHFRKTRKIEYLRSVCAELGIDIMERPSSTHADGLVMRIPAPDWLRDYTTPGLSAPEKDFRFEKMAGLNGDEVRGLFDGLVASDGSISKGRPQIGYSSTSEHLLQLFEVLSAMLGIDAHRTSTGVTSYHERGSKQRTTLQARPQYRGKMEYRGEVFCATTSTGLLMVRGGPDKFAFVCGNSSPIEHVRFTFEVSCELFTFAQWVRHRMGSFSVLSFRYSELADTPFYLPAELRLQDAVNHQGSHGALSPTVAAPLLEDILAHQEDSRCLYARLLTAGVCKEQARMVIPQSVYTNFLWTVDAHNLFHFLRLRLDTHAQWEIRQYAAAVLGLIRPIIPEACAAFDEYRRPNHALSATLIRVLRAMVQALPKPLVRRALQDAFENDTERREVAELLGVIGA